MAVERRKRESSILDAATRLFSERGYHATGVDEIGELAGLNGPVIYRYFSGKDEILSAIFDRAGDKFMQIPAGDDVDGFDQLIDGHLKLILRSTDIALILLREEVVLGDAARSRLHRRQRELVERWMEAIALRYPLIPDSSLEPAAYLVLGLLNSVAQWPKSTRTEEALQVVRTMASGAVEALVPRETAARSSRGAPRGEVNGRTSAAARGNARRRS